MSASNILRPAIALGLLLAAGTAAAQAQDPPARVGRIAWLAGPVSFSPAGSPDWAQAPLNRPLVAGDRLWTDAGARDEAQFGSSIARMDAGTLLTVLAADERTTQLQVSQGRVDVHVRRLAPGETVEVDTPNLAFVARQPGDYRLAVAPDGSTTDVTVLNGAGDVYGDGTSLALAPGEGYRFGGQDLDNYVLLPPAPPDDFDRWAMTRDQRYERAIARRYVPQGVIGAEDLDDYGSWRTVPDYGAVWVPDRAPRNWAPYHDGHWAWIDPWGWTWIDDQPYGYAVSHYGRWVRTPDTWAWVPAPPRAQPVYAPALVAFVGAVLAFGGRSDPGVGWFPLAPHEPYRPPYHASPRYVTNVNVTNTVINDTTIVNHVTNINYRNRNVPGAMVAMPAQQFAQAAPTARAAMLLPPGVARAAPVLPGPQARPLPQSRIGTPPAGRLPPAPVLRRVAVARALPAHAFAHGAGPVGVRPDGREDARMAAHGPVPLRVLRPAVGKPVTPQPARGPAPGAGREMAQGGRPGMPPGAVPARGAQPVAGMPRALAGAHGLPAGAQGPRFGPRPAQRPEGLAAVPQHAAAPGPRPHEGPFGHGRGAPPAAPAAGMAQYGGSGAGGVVDAGPRMTAHGVQPAPDAPAPRRPGEHAAPQPPRHDAPRGPEPTRMGVQAPHGQPAVHPAAPHAQPAPRAAPRVEPQPARPQQVAHAAPHPQAHVAPPSPPAPHPQAHAATPAPPRPQPQPQPQPHAAPHEPPHPQPQAHAAPPSPPAPHPHSQPHAAPPAPAHGPDKGGDHGHKHGEQGAH